MITIIKLVPYLYRLKFVILCVILYFIIYLLFKSQDYSTKPSVNKIIIPINETIIANNFHMDSNQTSSFSSYICDKQGPLNNHSLILYSYCFKLPIPINGWKRAKNYIESDIGFLIFTSSIFYHTRAISIRDTWLSRITHKYFLSTTPYSWLPITIIKGTGEDRLSNMKKIFYGLQIIYKQQQQSSNPHKWYYLAGCDTFLNVPHVLKRLDSFDSMIPYFVGGHSEFVVCPDTNNTRDKIEFPSGGAGFFISSTLLELMIPHLTEYVENIWPRYSKTCADCSDVALTCLINKLGIQLTKMPGFWSHNPDRILELHGRNEFHLDSEPNNFHYISESEMYDLDEFYSFLHVDRLVNDKNSKELIEYIRIFISSHYELLRLKRNECILPNISS